MLWSKNFKICTQQLAFQLFRYCCSQNHLGCLGSRLIYFAAGGAIRKRRQGGRRGNRAKKLGRALLGRSEMEASTGWTDGKPWEIAWGRAPLGRSETEATTGWTEGKLWEIAWGDLVVKERDGSGDRVDAGGNCDVGNSLGRAPLGRSEMEATTGWTGGKQWEIAWGESSVGKEQDPRGPFV